MVEKDEVVALSDAGSVIRFSIPGRGAPAADIFPLPAGPRLIVETRGIATSKR
jgi:hypothetical protein